MSPSREPGEAAVSGPIRVERDGGLAVVTVSSPPLNLFDAALARVSGVERSGG